MENCFVINSWAESAPDGYTWKRFYSISILSGFSESLDGLISRRGTFNGRLHVTQTLYTPQYDMMGISLLPSRLECELNPDTESLLDFIRRYLPLRCKVCLKNRLLFGFYYH